MSEQEPMTEARAREVLSGWIEKEHPTHLHGTWCWRHDTDDIVECAGYLCWSASTPSDTGVLDGEFTAEQLRAIAFWMENMKP